MLNLGNLKHKSIDGVEVSSQIPVHSDDSDRIDQETEEQPPTVVEYDGTHLCLINV